MVLVMLQFYAVFFQSLENHRLANTKLRSNFAHRHRLIHGFQYVLRRIEGPAASNLTDLDPVLMQPLADCLRIHTVHFSYLLTGMELVELLKLCFFESKD